MPSTAPPRSLTTTLAPRAASSSACLRPRPRPAPVTIATRPSKRSSDIPSPHIAATHAPGDNPGVTQVVPLNRIALGRDPRSFPPPRGGTVLPAARPAAEPPGAANRGGRPVQADSAGPGRGGPGRLSWAAGPIAGAPAPTSGGAPNERPGGRGGTPSSGRRTGSPTGSPPTVPAGTRRGRPVPALRLVRVPVGAAHPDRPPRARPGGGDQRRGRRPDPRRAAGWRLPERDPVTGAEFLSELYLGTDPSFTGRYTVPCIWDTKTGRWSRTTSPSSPR